MITGNFHEQLTLSLDVRQFYVKLRIQFSSTNIKLKLKAFCLHRRGLKNYIYY